MKTQTFQLKTGRPFRDEELLSRMLELRRQGWTYVSLAFLFGVDHSSIYKWCKIYRIPNPIITLAIDVPSIISIYRYESKRPKTYADYLEEARQRDVQSRHERIKTHA